VIYLTKKTRRVVHDGMDNVVYDEKCIKGVLTTVTKEIQSQSKKTNGPTPLLLRPL